MKPRIVSGFRDYLPTLMLARQEYLDQIRKIFETYGFVPIDTPAMEVEEILTDKYGEEGNWQIYRLTDRENKNLALRFDLTVPLARAYAMYHKTLPRPFKRYHIAPVWRADKPRPGRYREFMQCDVDTVGTKAMTADAEILILMADLFDSLDLKPFVIRINNRKILNGALDVLKIPVALRIPALRVLDKLEKAGLECVREELTRTELPPDETEEEAGACLGLPDDIADSLLAFITMGQEGQLSNAQALQNGVELLKGNKVGEEGLKELSQIMDVLGASRFSESVFDIDFSIARGLDYYTGPIFETMLLERMDFGSVCSGGRYDGLIGRFMKEQVPAVGTSIGIDRLFAALDDQGKLFKAPSRIQVIVTAMDRNYHAEYFKIAEELRQAGILTELYVGTSSNLGKQLQYADRLSVPLAVIAGSEEFKCGVLSIKDLTKALGDETKQWEISRQNLVATVKEWFEKRTKGNL